MKLENLHQLFLNSTGISTDSRKISKNCLFFALKGENFNGNAFANSAIEKGAYKVIIDEDKYQNENSVLVNDVLKTLQDLASFHRLFLNIPIIALTGSNGKTTTKELINTVLSKKFKTTATKGNLNNHIGVPLTLLSMNSHTELGIVEMGANHHNEIDFLCEIAKPDYGYITNFGKAHLEGFGSLQGVVEAKTEMYRYLKRNNKTVFVNSNDKKQVICSEGINKYTFGNKEQDCNIDLVDSSNKLLLSYQNESIHSNLIGLYNFNNIAAAIATGKYFNVSTEDIKSAIEEYIPTNNRSQLVEKRNNKIILDAYNANPSSMMAALENFIQSEGNNKVAFLGDMFELGSEANEEHQNIVNYLENHFNGTCYLIGENFNKTKISSSNIRKFNDFKTFNSIFKSQDISNNHILIKASRGMAMERILDIL